MKCKVCNNTHTHQTPFSEKDIKFIDKRPHAVGKISCGSETENAFVIIYGKRIETNIQPQYKGFMCGMSKARHKTVEEALNSFEEKQY